MYLEHWSLERPPFEAQPDSRFLFPAPQHEQARAVITYAACEGGEPVLLRGRAGCGKTILLRALRRQLPVEQYRVVFVPEVGCSQVGLLKRVVYHLAHTLVPDTAAAMDVLGQQVQQSEQNSQSIVLMLDDWPTDAGRDMLAELRWLLNLDLEGRPLGVFLSGADIDPEAHWPAWLAQRLLTTAALGPLTPEQVPAYLEHRLQAAAKVPTKASATIFVPEAAELIAAWSGGVPRLINRAAHLALHVAGLDLAPRVERDAVARALERLAAVSQLRTDSQRAAPAAVLGAAT